MDRKAAWVFVGSLCVTVSFFVYPYMQTKDAPHADGNTVIGFPYAAYSFGGGMCAFDEADGIGGKRACPAAWMPLENILFDMLFVIGLPFLLAATMLRRKRLIARQNLT